MGISVIVPVASGDQSWANLLPDLKPLHAEDEIIFISPDPETQGFRDAVRSNNIPATTKWVESAQGRARQLNVGAAHSTKEFFWFLHCDSRAGLDSVEALKSSLISNHDAVLFLDLKFLGDGPAFMAVNSFGAWFRSRILRLPFGDQGLCVSKTVFNELGGFDEAAPYGEDHLFVWKAHQKRIPLVCVGKKLFTSARKYQERGWAMTTSLHVWLTFRQALPQLAILLRNRWEER